MASTVTRGTGNRSRFATVTIDPATGWDSLVQFPTEMRIVAIEMVPVAAGDMVVVRDGQGGPRIFTHIANAAYDIAVRYYNQHEKFSHRGVSVTPYIAAAECVGAVDVTFELA